jgi:thioester reductase-like protein
MARSESVTTRRRRAPGDGARRRGAEWEGASGEGVLLTGTTGFVGMALLARYLERSERTVYVLVRGEDDRAAATRTAQTLRALYGPRHRYTKRVVTVRGDLTRSDLDLGSRRDALAERVSEVVHGAASVSFELPLAASRQINVEGTRRMLELAERCQARGSLRRFSYISTAYVAGKHSGWFSEDDLDVGQDFRNPYERSKFEAETLVTQRRAELPISIMRPSIVVGERASGWTVSFNGLYWPLHAFARGAFAVLPARREAPVDIVPVDYVADATYALTQMREAEGVTFNLTAGAHTSTVGELVDLTTSFFQRPAPPLLDPWLYRRLVHPVLTSLVRDERLRRALSRSKLFFPYFTAGVRYDDRRARVALRGRGIAQTPLRSYFDRLLAFALASGWGRRPIPRVRAAEVLPAVSVGARTAEPASKSSLAAAV